MIRKDLVKSWSPTQGPISLSSGEAEFYGVVKASGIALGYQALLRDLGVGLPVRVWTDSTATMGICGRSGLGKLRHVDTRSLWVQQRVRDKSLEIRKVHGEVNPADLFTKHLSSEERVTDLLRLFGCRFSTGRAAGAPALRVAGRPSDPVLAVTQGGAAAGRLIERDGVRFEAVEVSEFNVLVPEARIHDTTWLPHEYGSNIGQLFLRALAADELPEVPELPDALEHRGARLGKA